MFTYYNYCVARNGETEDRRNNKREKQREKEWTHIFDWGVEVTNSNFIRLWATLGLSYNI